MSLLGLLGRGFGKVTVVAPSVVVADLRNGLGATAMITGGDASATNTVWTLPWRRTCLLGTWTSSGSRTGPGVVALTLDDGIYFGYAKSSSTGGSAISQIVQFSVTNGLDPLHYRCLVGVRDVLLGLSLTGIAEANTAILKHVMRTPERIGVGGGAVVTPVMETRARHDSRRDELGYTVQVALFSPSNQQLVDGLKKNLDWRARLTNALSQTLLPGVPEIHTVDCLPGTLLDLEAFQKQWDVSVQNFRCYTAVENAIYPPSI